MWLNKTNYIGFILLSIAFISCGSETNATHADTDVKSVIYCEENFRVQNNICVSCDPGMVRDSGDSPEEEDTFCEPDACNVALGLPCYEFYQAYIKSSNSDEGDQFGFSIALYGDTLAVGAPHEDSEAAGINGDQDNNDLISSGAVYIFTRSGSTWTQQAYIKASNPDEADYFGYSVALYDDMLAVGAPYEDSSSTGINNDQNNNMDEYSGAVYIFTRSGSIWTQQAYIKASNPDPNDGFGFSIALDNETLAVGAPYEDSSSTGINSIPNNDISTGIWNGPGAVYVFTHSDAIWTQQAYIKPSKVEDFNLFGSSVSIEDDLLVVGEPFEDNDFNEITYDSHILENISLSTNSGAIYTFIRSNTEWRQEVYIKASNSYQNAYFGNDVDVHSNTFIVGAFREANYNEDSYNEDFYDFRANSGAAYLFASSESKWIEHTYFKPSELYENDEFGRSVAIYGDRIAISAPTRTYQGNIYLYSRSEDEELEWNRQMVIDISILNGNDSSSLDRDHFGYRVELYENTLVSGMPHEDSNATGINGNQEDRSSEQSGAVYVMILE